jgi:hypothetical protein
MRSHLLTPVFFAALLLLPAFADEPSKQPALPIAKTVILSGKMKVSEALIALTKQTGIAVNDRRGEPDAEIQIECKNVTFWQALDTIADAANAQIDLYTPHGKLALKKGSGKAKTKDAQTVSYDGLFRTSIKQITAAIDPESGQTTYKAALEVAWEPTLQPFYLETRPQNLVVKDAPLQLDLGKAEAPVDGRNALLFETPLPSLPREAKMIGHMAGNLSIVAPNRMLMFSFESLNKLNEMLSNNKTPKRVQDGVECQISKLTLRNDRWTVTVSLSYPPGNTKLDSNQSWVVNNELVLESLDGKRRFPATSYVLEFATPRSASVTYNFQDDAKATRLRGKPEEWMLTYRTPAAVVTIPFAFSFKNVRLP